MDEDVERVQKDVEARTATRQTQPQPSKLRQGLHRAGSPDPQIVEASIIAPPPGPQRRSVSPPSDHGSGSGSSSSGKGNKSRRERRKPEAEGPSSPFPSIREEDEVDFFETSRRATSAPQRREKEKERKGSPLGLHLGEEERDIPPQTVLTRVIGELEADFKHYKS